MKSANFCYRNGRRALTLIEVVAGLSLLSIVLVTSLVGMRRHENQAKTAKAKLQAVDVAEQLLSGWYQSSGFVPVPQSGTVFAGKNQLNWQTQPLLVPQLGIPKVRLTIRQPGIGTDLVAVEVLATPPPPVEVRPR